MVFFNGVDVSAKTISIILDYDVKKEQEVMELVRKDLGSNITITDLKEIIPEIEEFIEYNC